MAAKEFKIRGALVEAMEVVTRLGILENRHFGSHNLASAYAADPSGFFVGELNSEVISHIHAIKYPAHSAFIGTFIVAKEHKGKGYGGQTWDTAWKSVDKTYTIGIVAVAHTVSKYKALGFCAVWNTFVGQTELTKPTSAVNFEKVYSYVTSVYSTLRRPFIEKWINMPGMLCWAAINVKGDIVGYIAIRQFKAKETRLHLSPLYVNKAMIPCSTDI